MPATPNVLSLDSVQKLFRIIGGTVLNIEEGAIYNPFVINHI